MTVIGIVYYSLGVNDDEVTVYEGPNLKPFAIEIA
jgi:hypothetical protein